MAGKRIAPQGQLTIGLDIGYGVVKAVTRDQVITFPSICGHAREIKFRAEEIANRYPGDQLTDDTGSWFIGDLAASQLPPGEQLRLRGRTANEDRIGNVFRVRLAKAAIGKLLAGRTNGEAVHIKISTGLPTDHMRDQAALKAALVGQHPICTDAANFVANVTEVHVMPQPYGALFSQFLLPTGELNPRFTWNRAGVVDVGTYTVDLIVDDNGEYIDMESGSVESGVYTAQQRIAELLERDHRQKLPPKVIERILRTGYFQSNGDPVDYRREVQEALEPLRSATLSLISEKWKAGANVEVIFLAGGGAALVQEEITELYRQAIILENAQLANACGYLAYALHKAQP